ncbi:hypothetical protein [Flavobacterium sp. LB2P53]|uniref:hypothetical protein n=1 Tax=Flavobacterium sp. LB2P53 TaxID=2497481 RepID=UPI000F83FD4C|nr:hypothetical protein [Flavobacterium sp. LB2P53]RTY71558.1 hypothetical protein EKL95_02325 [Flavobacterium sp. LB2P53]
MNTILIKRKLTAGAPALSNLAIGEMCLVIPDSKIYWKKDASTIVDISGDMLKSIYDTNNNGRVDNSDNSQQLGGVDAALYATNAYVTAQINALVNGSSAALDTLAELATALGNDANFSNTITTLIGTKLDGNSTIDGGTF